MRRNAEERVQNAAQARQPESRIRDDVMALVAQQEDKQNSKKGRAQLIALGICIAVLAAAIFVVEPWKPRGTEEPRSSEARAALGLIKDRARDAYRRDPDLKEIVLKDLVLGEFGLKGSYFNDIDYTCGGPPEKFWAECRNVYSSQPKNLRIECNLKTGSSIYNR